MSIKAVALSVIVGALTTTGAFAQTSIGTISVTDEDLPRVAQYCSKMAGKSPSDASDVSPTVAERLATPNVMLSSLSQSDCQRAGLI